MRFTVVWSEFAQDQLAVVWLLATDRNAVARAQHDIDQALRVDPRLQGIPFFGARALVIPPLRVRFAVNDMDMLFEVFDVW